MNERSPPAEAASKVFQKPNVSRPIILVSGLAVAGSFVSFVNQLVLAQLFGATRGMDLFLTAASVPIALNGLVGGVLGYRLVPYLIGARSSQTPESQVTSGLLALLVIPCGLIAAIGIVFAQQTVTLLGAQQLSDEALKIGTTIAQLHWSSIPFSVASSIFIAVLHVRQHFAVATLVQPTPVIGSLLITVLFYRSLGILAPAVGQLLGYVAMTCMLGYASRPTITYTPNWKHAGSLKRGFCAALLALLIFTAYPISDAYWAGRIGEAAVSHMGYVQRLIIAISGFVVVGVSTVTFPIMAAHAASGQLDALRTQLAGITRNMLVFIAPAVIFLGVFAMPVMQLLFQRGAFSIIDARATAEVLPMMLSGMLFMSCGGLAFKALFAASSMDAAALISVGGFLAYFCLSGLLSAVFETRGIAAAYAITWCSVVAVAFWHLRPSTVSSKIWPLDGWFVLRLLASCLIVGVVAEAGSLLLPAPDAANTGVRCAIVLATGAACVAVYLAVGSTRYGTEEARAFSRLIVVRLGLTAHHNER